MRETHCFDISFEIRTALKGAGLTIINSRYEVDGVKLWALHSDGQMYQVKVMKVDQMDEVISSGC